MRSYLRGLAFALPASLVFMAYRGFNVAVSRPKAVMVLQLGGLALKVPINALLVFGFALPTPFGTLALPALGAAGLRHRHRDRHVVPAAGGDHGGARATRSTRPSAWATASRPPNRNSLAALLRLGIPMGLSILIEVTGFTFMAFFISRIGATPVAGHQIAVNMVSLMFMLPLSIANASSTLVAQRIGAGDIDDARRIGWAGLEIGVLVAAVLGSAVYLLREPLVGLYTSDPVIVAAALPLLAWVVLFHVADAAQTIAAFVLRAYRIATVPLVVYVVAIWVIGLGGGYVAVFDLDAGPAWLRGAQGFWSMATLGVALAAVCLAGFLGWTPAPRARRGAALSAAGSVIRKHVPPPSRGSQRTLPPWRSAICLTSDRPRPTPPACSAWPGRRKNGSKIRSRISAGTPAPRSQTWTVVSPPLAARRPQHHRDLAAAVAARVLEQVAQGAAQQPLVAGDRQPGRRHRPWHRPAPPPRRRRRTGRPGRDAADRGRRRAGWRAAPPRPARRARRRCG